MKNISTNQTYQNTNLEALEEAALKCNYDSRIWGTFVQWKSVGRTVKKGEKGTEIIRVIERDILNVDGEKVERKIVRRYTIFNLEQTKEI